MALSGLQVTRLWPYGGPGHQYGDFSGKEEAPAPEIGDGGPNVAFLVFPWIWATWKVTE